MQEKFKNFCGMSCISVKGIICAKGINVIYHKKKWFANRKVSLKNENQTLLLDASLRKWPGNAIQSI